MTYNTGGTTNLYDAAGQRTVVTNALGFTTRYGHFPSSSLKAMTNALGTNYVLYSDAAGACSACGNSGSVTDCLGRVTESVTSPHGLPLQAIRRASAGATGANAATNTTTYLSGLTTPEQEAEEYPVAMTDEGGRTRRYAYTDFGQLHRATDLSGATWWTNQFDLDSGALTNVLSPTGAKLSYFYDDLDNVKALIFADGGALTNFYDSANRMNGARLPSGTLLTNFFDFAGRPTNRQASVSGSVTENTSFWYNPNDAVTIMTDNSGSTTNVFDPAGRLIGIDFPTGVSVRYALDLLDRIVAITNKASAGGTAYVTQYRHDAVGNVTNVVDQWGANTYLEYDRVNRRTKRTLPNNVVTEWQYNWRDQITNITHKLGSTVLASVAYERAAGGEPTRITREDGSYVLLAYDVALRLTNEVSYSSGATPQSTNGYGYDASGTRIRLVKGGVAYTNAVTLGYRVTQVKTNGNVVETYDYDSGGRITNIVRSGVTLTLGYNSGDQVAAVTNGAAWTQYGFDGAGRRTRATDQAGTQRRFLLASTPGTDLESPQLIADSANAPKQAYVFLEDRPLMRFDASGGNSRVYYLEDGMGSIIGLTPHSSPSTNNTTRLFYDGFGNTLATNGPAPALPAGTGGDFRFHGLWLEDSSGLYHARARDYDPRTGRFTSRDPRNGVFQRAETLNPYVYAVNNPQVFTDRSGEFTLIEINVSSVISASFQSLRSYAINRAKKHLKETIFDAVSKVVMSQLGDLYPPLGSVWDALHDNEVAQAGRNFEAVFKKMVCGAIGADGPLSSMLWFYPEIKANGDATRNGLNCPNISAPGFDANRFYPDFILSEVSPKETSKLGASGKSIFIGDFKLSGNSLYKQYVEPGRHRAQFDAITRYAGRHTYTRTAVFLTVFTGQKKNLRQVQALLGGDGLKKGVVVIVIAAEKNRNFND